MRSRQHHTDDSRMMSLAVSQPSVCWGPSGTGASTPLIPLPLSVFTHRLQSIMPLPPYLHNSLKALCSLTTTIPDSYVAGIGAVISSLAEVSLQFFHMCWYVIIHAILTQVLEVSLVLSSANWPLKYCRDAHGEFFYRKPLVMLQHTMIFWTRSWIQRGPS